MSLLLFDSKLSCEHLVLPGYKDGVVIQPGLFKGTYGDHGLELVLLTYEDDDTKAIITKITVCTCLQTFHAVLTYIIIINHVFQKRLPLLSLQDLWFLLTNFHNFSLLQLHDQRTYL